MPPVTNSNVVSPFTKVSCGRCVTTNTGTPKPGSSPQPSTKSGIVRPTIQAARDRRRRMTGTGA
jgi:hypothetical protein